MSDIWIVFVVVGAYCLVFELMLAFAFALVDSGFYDKIAKFFTETIDNYHELW